jgi:hypothetical protein
MSIAGASASASASAGAGASATYFFVYMQSFYTDAWRPRKLLGVFTTLTDAKAFYGEQDTMVADVFLNMVMTGPTGRVVEERQIY